MVEKPFYPHEGKYFDRGGGVKMHYFDIGAGDPVVMLHGNPSWSFYYRNLAKALSPNFRVIVPDHIGCGKSDKPGDDKYSYVLSSRIKDLENLLDSIGATKNIHLVVHDWGGMIGAGYAVRHPERIKSITVLNTGAFFLPASKPFPFALWLCRTPLGALLIRGFNAFALATAKIGCKRVPLSPYLVRAYTGPYDSWANRIATLRFVQDIPLSPDHPSFAEVKRVEDNLALLADKPMLICWGEKDFVFDRHFLARWRELFPKARVLSFADCGHYILEDAAKEVIPAITDFLSGQKNG